ncbi:DEAD/DEAH box helicase family protein [Streptomyces sp. NPDC058735]|uniref:DEAD/DEAH box helicase family protein n=1 Tax=unclassified Streptomyces TaxID=2593676 RepID=UPI0036737533
MPLLETHGLRMAQIEAIMGLEGSLAADTPCVLIQMATGAGKTFTTAPSTACGAVSWSTSTPSWSASPPPHPPNQGLLRQQRGLAVHLRIGRRRRCQRRFQHRAHRDRPAGR